MDDFCCSFVSAYSAYVNSHANASSMFVVDVRCDRFDAEYCEQLNAFENGKDIIRL